MEEINFIYSDDDVNDWYKFKFTHGGLSFLCLVVLILLIIQTYYFIKFYRFKNKLLIMFFIMLNISLFWRIVYFIEEIFMRDWKDYFWNVHKNQWVNGFMSYINLMFFLSAVIFNLFNWLLTMNRINQVVQLKGHSNLIFIISLYTLQILLLLLFISVWLSACVFDKDFETSDIIYGYIVSVSYFIISIAFSVVGYLYYK